MLDDEDDVIDYNEDEDFDYMKVEKANDDNQSYELVYSSKLEDDEKPLSRVVGHESQKKELLSVIDWFKHSKELKEKGISIPKGVILFGEPGNGKSLLIKEIIRCCEAPVFIFQGEKENIPEGIIETFKKAREAGHAIIVIDEIDLLINRERRVVRTLQECLDGVEEYDDILVLVATNYIREIPDPLLRCGRLEKLIKIPDPTGEEALELLKKHFKEFNLKFPEDFDEEEMELSLTGLSCAGVKSVVNDIVLRNGFEGIKEKMIDEPYFLDDKNKIYIPFFSRSLNQLYVREPEKLLVKPYSDLKDNFADSIVDPFDTYGALLYDSLYTRLLRVGTHNDETADFHYDTNTIYFVIINIKIIKFISSSIRNNTICISSNSKSTNTTNICYIIFCISCIAITRSPVITINCRKHMISHCSI